MYPEKRERSESNRNDISVNLELSPVLKPETFIDLSSLRAFYSKTSSKTKSAKQKKRGQDNVSSGIFNVLLFAVLSVASYMIIVEGLSILQNGTSAGLAPFGLFWIGYSTYQLYTLMKESLRVQEKMGRKIKLEACVLTENDQFKVLLSFLSTVTSGCLIFMSYLKMLNATECVMVFLTFCLTFINIAWTVYLLHVVHEVLQMWTDILNDWSRNVLAVKIFVKKMCEIFIVTMIFLFRKLVCLGMKIIEEGYPFTDNHICQKKNETSHLNKGNVVAHCEISNEEHKLFNRNSCHNSEKIGRNDVGVLCSSKGHAQNCYSVTCSIDNREEVGKEICGVKQSLTVEDKKVSMKQGKTYFSEAYIGGGISEIKVFKILWRNWK